MMHYTLRWRNKCSPMNVDFRAVIHFLWRKGYCNLDILSEPEDVDGHGVMTLKTMERATQAFTKCAPS
jgi:hypothetical protein